MAKVALYKKGQYSPVAEFDPFERAGDAPLIVIARGDVLGLL